MAKVTYNEVILENEEEDEQLVKDIKENLKKGSNKELVKEALKLYRSLS
ncbi:hypothetical protein [Acidianus sp. HS-5]|nr:hypothetical protein [Acidianus sp. HS-5]BDC17439.1 hypothetical protein HS5_03290 [Acidianus sp. HS-5]